jgi:hypothetical protein
MRRECCASTVTSPVIVLCMVVDVIEANAILESHFPLVWRSPPFRMPQFAARGPYPLFPSERDGTVDSRMRTRSLPPAFTLCCPGSSYPRRLAERAKMFRI